MPQSSEMLEMWDSIGEPRRHSGTYRIRDSLLDNPFTVLSPNALKSQLNNAGNKLEAVDEEKENEARLPPCSFTLVQADSETVSVSSTRSRRRVP